MSQSIPHIKEIKKKQKANSKLYRFHFNLFKRALSSYHRYKGKYNSTHYCDVI